MVTRLTKVIWSIAKTIGVLRAAIRVLSTGSRRQRIAISRQRIAIDRLRIAIGRQRIAIWVLRCGHPLGCEELWGNREEDEGTGVADGGAWERKKRVDIADWLCLHAFIIDHKKEWYAVYFFATSEPL